MWLLRNHGILGQNARNLSYISTYNTRLSKRLADSKIKTKEFLLEKGVKVPQSLGIIKNHLELDNFNLDSLVPPFVIKPNAGYGGKGIIVVEKKDTSGNFISNDNKTIKEKKLKEHCRDILDGFYSLSGSRDKILFEKKIILDSSIELLGKFGLPDIRVIVFNNVPVIAMLRVPTSNSKGKANLHSGACGLGIDIGSGKITYMKQFGKSIKSIPGIGDVRGIEIPNWNKILKLAVKVQQITNIGYIGCDIVLDDNLGPILLEMNVRPGLEVQVVNKVPLLERLKKVENIKINSIEKGVRLSRDLFGGDIEAKIRNISGKKVLGNREYIEIIYDKNVCKTIGEIKSHKINSYINTDYLLNIVKFPKEKIKNDTVKLKCNVLGEVRNVKFGVKKLDVSNIILGKEVLYNFLVDPFKYKESDLPIDTKNPILKEKNRVILKGYEEQLLKLDKKIIDIDKKLKILRFVTPKNIENEKIKFVSSNGKYKPKFEYNDISLDLKTLQENILSIEISDIPLSGIYNRKKEEIINKIKFLKALKKQNTESLNKYSNLLYGGIIKENLDFAENLIFNKPEIEIENEFLTFEEIKNYITKFNHIYDINIIIKRRNIISRFFMSGNRLCFKYGGHVGKKEIRSIIAHEIESHHLRKINGRKLKYKIFSIGTAKYLSIEEGIAIYNQNKFLSKKDKKYYSNSEIYYFINFALKNSYKDLVSKLKEYFKNDYELVFKYLLRMKRGIKNVEEKYVFSKDAIYLNGFLEVKNFLQNGGDLKELYFGKIGVVDLEEIKKSDFLDFKANNFKIPLFV